MEAPLCLGSIKQELPKGPAKWLRKTVLGEKTKRFLKRNEIVLQREALPKFSWYTGSVLSECRREEKKVWANCLFSMIMVIKHASQRNYNQVKPADLDLLGIMSTAICATPLCWLWSQCIMLALIEGEKRYRKMKSNRTFLVCDWYPIKAWKAVIHMKA